MNATKTPPDEKPFSPVPEQPTPPDPSFQAEAEALSASFDKLVRRAFGEMPKSVDLADLRAHQASLLDLVRRAEDSGGGARKDLAALSAERDQAKEAATRARADFLNYQARAAKDLQRAEELALRGYVGELLPILDSLELSLRDAASGKSDAARLGEALGLIAQSLEQVLKVRGLEKIEALGKPYDPTRHEPVATRPADSARQEKPNVVAEMVRTGYLWKGLLLRPAQVLLTAAEKPEA